MARQSFIPVAVTTNGGNTAIYSGTLGAAGTSGAVTTGYDMIIRIACSGAIAVRFGTTANLSTVTATDMYFPAGVYVYDMGHLNNAIDIYAFAAATVVTVNEVSKN